MELLKRVFGWAADVTCLYIDITATWFDDVMLIDRNARCVLQENTLFRKKKMK